MGGDGRETGLTFVNKCTKWLIPAIFSVVKTSKFSMSNFDDLPEDLLRDLLLRLPIKTLGQCQCVSKPWSTLIGNPEFIKKHLNSLAPRNPNCFIVLAKAASSPCIFYAADFESEEKFSATLENLYFPPWNSNEVKYKLIGSYNGLICLLYRPRGSKNCIEDIILCNPLTKKHWTLPLPDDQLSLFRSKNSVVHGFGYDDVNDDYKVVRLVIVWKENVSRIQDAMVYSLKSNLWRKIHGLGLNQTIVMYYFDVMYGVLFDFNLHWLLDDGYILAIDLRTEKQRLLKLPEESRWGKLCAVKGCLSSFDSGWNGVEIWMMKKYGEEDSWTKLRVNWDETFKSMRLFLISRDDEKLIFTNIEDGIVWYDIKKNECSYINYGEHYPHPYFFGVHPFVFSLVEPSGGSSADEGSSV